MQPKKRTQKVLFAGGLLLAVLLVMAPSVAADGRCPARQADCPSGYRLARYTGLLNRIITGCDYVCVQSALIVYREGETWADLLTEDGAGLLDSQVDFNVSPASTPRPPATSTPRPTPTRVRPTATRVAPTPSPGPSYEDLVWESRLAACGELGISTDDSCSVQCQVPPLFACMYACVQAQATPTPVPPTATSTQPTATPTAEPTRAAVPAETSPTRESGKATEAVEVSPTPTVRPKAAAPPKPAGSWRCCLGGALVGGPLVIIFWLALRRRIQG